MTNTTEYDTMIIADTFTGATREAITRTSGAIAREFPNMPLGECLYNAMIMLDLI